MKKHKNNRKNYCRLKSGHDRLGLGFDHYEVLWRRMELIENAVHPKSVIRRVSDKAMAITARSYKHLWGIDARVFYQSPYVPKSQSEQPHT